MAAPTTVLVLPNFPCREWILPFRVRKRRGFSPVQPTSGEFYLRCWTFGLLDCWTFADSFRPLRQRLASRCPPTCATWSMPMKASTSGRSLGSSSRNRCGRQPETIRPWPRFFASRNFGGFEDRVHALLLRGVNERAGVDDDGVGLRGVVGDFDAVLQQRAEHDFGVHEILGAAERNQADAQRAFRWNFFSSQAERLASLGARQSAERRRKIVSSHGRTWRTLVDSHVVSAELVEMATACAATALVATVSAGIPSWVRSTARAAKGRPVCGSSSWLSTVAFEFVHRRQPDARLPLMRPSWPDNGHKFFARAV